MKTTPPDCDLRDFAFLPLDIGRLFGSEFHAVANDTEWRAGVTLWLKSWHQVPAASLPDDDVMLCRLAELGRDLKLWRKVRDVALRGWIKGEDGRLYHPVVAEKAREAWDRKQAFRRRTEKARQARQQKREEAITEAVTSSVTENVKPAVTATTGTGTGTGTIKSSVSDETGAAAPSDPGGGVDPAKRAWDDAVSLLTGTGGMKPAAARAFFGKLLSRHELRPADMLGALGTALANQTGEPQAYLERAAQGIAQRRSREPTAPQRPEDIDWTVRLAHHRAGHSWPELQWGPPPGHPQCQCPPALLEAAT